MEYLIFLKHKFYSHSLVNKHLLVLVLLLLRLYVTLPLLSFRWSLFSVPGSQRNQLLSLPSVPRLSLLLSNSTGVNPCPSVLSTLEKHHFFSGHCRRVVVGDSTFRYRYPLRPGFWKGKRGVSSTFQTEGY